MATNSQASDKVAMYDKHLDPKARRIQLSSNKKPWGRMDQSKRESFDKCLSYSRWEEGQI